MEAVFEYLQEAECQPCSVGKCTHLRHRGADGRADLSEQFQKAIAVFSKQRELWDVAYQQFSHQIG